MQKSFVYIVVLLLAVAVLVYYYQVNNAANAHGVDQKKQQKPAVNIKQSDIPANNYTKKPSTNKNKKTVHSIAADNQAALDSEGLEDKKNKEKEEELDYITAYRNWNYFENCYTDVEDFHNNKDPLETLAQRFANNPRESQIEPTPQQNIYYQHHVDICKTLIDDDKDDYYQVRQKLNEKFYKIKPATDEEKQLEHAIAMVRQLRQLKQKINNSHYGKSNLSAVELDALNTKMHELTTQMMLIYDENDELSEQQALLVKQYSDQIEEISNKIAESKAPDNAQLVALQKQQDAFINSIDDYLHHVTSSDAFLLLANTIYRIEYYQKDATIIKTLKQATGIKDPYYINMLNVIVMPLIACSMNYPCDADSDLMLSYCLGLRDSMFNQACGLNLEDFYFNFYIGANQLNDVNVYFNFLVSRYAQ